MTAVISVFRDSSYPGSIQLRDREGNRMKVIRVLGIRTFWIFGMAIGWMTTSWAEPPSSKPVWHTTMQELSATLSDIILDSSSLERFSDPKNGARVVRSAKRMLQLTKDLRSKQMKVPDADPSVKLIAGFFEEDAQHYYETVSERRGEYARIVARSFPSYCIACHSRTAYGPQYGTDHLPKGAEKLPALDRADYFAATRQFKAALGAYRTLSESTETSKNDPFGWQRAVRNGLALSIRIQGDAERAMEFVNAVRLNPNSPLHLKETAETWKTAVESWSKEKPKSGDALVEATRLLAEARKRQEYPADRRGDIELFRATESLHRYLSNPENREPKRVAEAYYLAGQAYDVLRPLAIWDMQDFYYVGCIREVPHTPLARDCYRRYEESVYFAHSGSSGVYLPKPVRRRLEQLEVLAAPEGPHPNVKKPN
jgi:hypothetical protein